jgi:hypothetical protein
VKWLKVGDKGSACFIGRTVQYTMVSGLKIESKDMASCICLMAGFVKEGFGTIALTVMGVATSRTKIATMDSGAKEGLRAPEFSTHTCVGCGSSAFFVQAR